MAQFDPLKKPMSLQESEDLLKGAADREHAKDARATMAWVILFLLAVAATLGALFFGLLGGAGSVAPVLLVLFLLFLPFLLNKKK